MGSTTSSAKLSTKFYSKTCPNLHSIVKSVVKCAVSKEKRMGGSLLHLHFLDYFVNGCDGSILLGNTSSFKGEKTTGPNYKSVRGYNVIDYIKSKVEAACPGVVSCADIVIITARDSTVILGGPTWDVKLGRRDSKTASFSLANDSALPAFTFTLKIHTFKRVGLSTKDMVALSGSYIIGQPRFVVFQDHIYHDTNINSSFAKRRQENCPSTGYGGTNFAPLDYQSPKMFDNNYYKNLIIQKGLLHSDQVLHGDGSTEPLIEKYSKSLVEIYSKDPEALYSDFAAAMIKMGDIKPLTESKGEIRNNCRKVNYEQECSKVNGDDET
ncbi:hypothetical protein TEA_009023 [Camellia sinensis var. sinensis]|uniref:Peroxidase n=2 Tax=Camellia sinensis TaxID=4442 RepID=A0A4S4ERA0_CAMSN|nr:hypothetical protein TEA_009023 [Camellia sinensis var. sinensis]